MLTAPGISPHRLDLKINCICAIQRNDALLPSTAQQSRNLPYVFHVSRFLCIRVVRVR
ncbi:hypothetical protein C8R48DRAFT_723537 [Suillus tomentosus]|nr:hypothetical protein C8R48DRAFT_723537 [Suillus tomentosus]